ncbi:MAG: tyrosine-type recombinase/integrase [Cyclobacteriaceae bacterium]|nr:tyrosine-type recombinase/integrase [Cytophagales bacterium]MCZ8327083.1 tyrosine-type recombinase/integrase [Cyclobacteriaceae bacterium]
MIAIRLWQNRSKKRKDGLCPIYFVLAKGSERKFIATKKYLKPEHFDNATGNVLRGADNAIKLNAFFKRQMTLLDDIIIDIKNSGIEPTFEMIDSKFRNKSDTDFLAFAFAELRIQKSLLSYKTYFDYKLRLEALQKYRQSIPFNTINYDFLTAYKFFLVSKGRKPNGYYQDFACIKKFYRLAVVKNLAKGNPFENFKMEKEDVVKDWLTKDELQKLYRIAFHKHDTLTAVQQNTLRHFLFCCFTGIRFGDKLKFSTDHIVDGRIQLKTNKTGKTVLIPFNTQAQELLPYVLKHKLKLSNTRVNNELKICCEAVGIYKHITWHCSRHTFAINCLLVGVDLITVRDWLGHSSVTTTEIYAKIAAQYKDESMKKLDGFLLAS